VSQTRILLIGNASGDAVTTPLGRHERVVTRIAEVGEAVAAAPDHELVVLDLAAKPAAIAAACHEIRAIVELSGVPLLAITSSDDVEERISLLEAGADDVMIRPIDDRELDARVEALHLRFRRSRELEPSVVVSTTRREGRRMIVVFSPKGGVGTTSVAVNLALALTRRQPDRVALVDLIASGGQVATHLDIRPKLTIADLVRDSQVLSEPEAVRATYLTRHERGLFVLASPPDPKAARAVDADRVTAILEAVLSAFPTVVVDAGSQLDDRVAAALKLADDLVVVVSPDFPALKAVHALFEYLVESGTWTGEPMVVVSEIHAVQLLTPEDVETAIGKKVSIRIPHEALVFLRAVNEGRPLQLSAAGSVPAHRIDQLAAVILGEDAPPTASETRRRGLSALFSRT
jgi:pilus assembly protein CpaE